MIPFMHPTADASTPPFRRWAARPAVAFVQALAMGCGLCAVNPISAVLDWRTNSGYRLAAIQPSDGGPTGFTLLAPGQTGIVFTNLLPEARHLTNQILPNGSGIAAGDIDADGWCDLFFCGLKDSGCQLYRNLGGWRFTNVTAQAGVACVGRDNTGAAFADLDGDSDLDLIVNSLGGGTRIFFNDGHGHFTPGPQPLNDNLGGTSLALADANGDGALDLYVANYRVTTLTDMPGTRFSVKMVNGQPMVVAINGRPPTDPEWTNRFRFKFEIGPGGRGKFGREELGESDAYFVNDGRGHFTPASFTSGTFLDETGESLKTPLFDWGLSVLFRDLNGDGAPDLYVCNDFGTPDRLWWNDGHGHFRLAPLLAIRQTSLASMAVDAADLDRDGYDDLVVLDMLSRDHRRRLEQRNILRAELAPVDDIAGRPQYPRNTLLWNRGDGTYAEIAQFAGLEASEWSWNPILLDVDLDGYEDLLVPNGFVRDNMNLDAMNRILVEKAKRRLSAAEELSLRALYPPLNTPNLAFRNLGNLKFAECSQAWGFDQPTISQGACLADLDNDGDLDLVVNNLNRVAGLYRNDSSAPRVAVRLRGQPPNTGGIGARIEVNGGPVRQTQQIVCGGRYCSDDQAQRTFAAGAARSLEVRVRWRSGRESAVSNVPPNTLVEVSEPAGPIPTLASPAAESSSLASSIRFADASDALRHVHQDAPFDDFERQPLLPHKLSQLGPGVAWWDLDGDGREDLVIGSGRGGKLAWFRNLGEGRFERGTGPAWDAPLERDAAGFAGVAPGALLVAFANYEDGATNGPGVVRLAANSAKLALPLAVPSFGPLAVADYDGDGSLGLFVGARAFGGRYPAPARSALYRQKDGEYIPDQTNNRALPLALVSGAVWTDLTGDGWPDLVLACDWDGIRIMRNERGHLTPWDPPLTWTDSGTNLFPNSPPVPRPASLAALTGWWNGVAAGDFDNDGRLDFIATNWGGNNRYEHWRPAPLQLYFGDFNDDGGTALLEAHFAPELGRFAPERMLDAVTRRVPGMGARFPTHAAWANAGIEDVLGEARDTAQYREAVWLESTLFLNRGDRFEVRVLPAEAQFAPAFAICVADADGDGNEDAFLSQNFFDVDLDTSRYDSGRGLWLRGDGQGGLRPVPGQESGVLVYGEQRGAAVADYDGDGRVDLAVTQNRAETKLFRNSGAQPGLRVRLIGPPGNPAGIGAVMRLGTGGWFGSAREIHAGCGYWSQDGAVQILASAQPANLIRVRWPGGRETVSAIPSDAREIAVESNGRIQVLAAWPARN